VVSKTPHLQHSTGRLRRIEGGLLLGLCLVLPICLAALPIHAETRSSDSIDLADRSKDQLRLVLEIKTFSLSVRDPSDRVIGPTIEVALGSPAMETPTGTFPLDRIILSPAWRPGAIAKRSGALSEPASIDTPMGAVKIPFANDGIIALHGGGDSRVLGKRISAGCVRATDADLLRVVAWLDRHDALLPDVENFEGELHRRFQRPVELIVR
jgi:hypothetical protein